jgi:hypothetical protein
LTAFPHTKISCAKSFRKRGTISSDSCDTISYPLVQ